MGGDRGPAAGAARLRRGSLSGFASLHGDDVHARLQHNRARADDRPPRHRPALDHLRRHFGDWFCCRRLRAEPRRVHGRPCADRSGRRNGLRADDGGHFALVRQAARTRGRRCRVRQLLRRNDLAALDEPRDAADRLAGNLRRHRRHRRRRCPAARSGDAPPPARGGVRASRGGDRGRARRRRHIAAAAAGSARSRRLFLLRRDVDAAGPSGRLLRRSRLWRRAGSSDAVADDGCSASSRASAPASSPTPSAARRR